MLRITTLFANGSPPILKLEGKLLGPWVDEVRQACAAGAALAGGLHLDLAAVTYADAAGAQLLRELLQRKVTVVACSVFVAALLEREVS